MKSFKERIKGKSTIGSVAIDASDALGSVFKEDKNTKIINVKIKALSENPFQPRKIINQEELKGLSDSIKENGLLQPITVSPKKGSMKDFYIVAGHRRVKAIELLKIDEIKAIVVNFDDKELQINALIENMQRDNLTIIEEAIGVKNLLDAVGSQTKVCKILGKGKTTVSTLLKITTLEKEVIDYLEKENVNLGISILSEITKVPPAEQMKATKHIIDNEMKRSDIRRYIASFSEDKQEKVPPAELSYNFKNNKNKVNLKIDLEKITKEEKNMLIDQLEDLIKKLRN